MFKDLMQIANLMRQPARIKEEMERMNQRVAQLTVEGDAGGGMVKVRANGKMEILACTLTDEALKLNDRELLEDLIKGAVNQALEKAQKARADETMKMATDLGLPAGMSLPGIGG